MALSVNIERLSVDIHHAYRLGPLSLQMEPGQWLAVLGGNGSGKSQLASLLVGEFEETAVSLVEGRGEVLGHDIMRSEIPLYTKQWVQQSPYLQFSGCCFTVEDEVAFGPQNLALPAPEILSRVETALQRFGCQHLHQRNPQSLSGGEAQKVLLACMMVMHPKLLVLDQALGRLSKEATYQCLDAILQYSRELQCSVILLEHRIFPAVDYCQQLVLLDKGTTPPVDSHALLSLIPRVILPDQLKKILLDKLPLDKPPHHNDLWDVLKPFLRNDQAC